MSRRYYRRTRHATGHEAGPASRWLPAPPDRRSPRTYWLNLDLIYLYNREAFGLVQLIAVGCLVVAALSAAAASVGARHDDRNRIADRTAVQDTGPGTA